MDKRVTVAFYLPNMMGGGVERMRLILAPAFIARGMDVTVVLHQMEGELIPLLPPEVRVVSLNASRTLSALPKLMAYLRRERPDILLSSMGHNNIIALWARALARVNTAVIVCQHNALSNESVSMGSWQHKLLPKLYRWFSGMADGIVTVSQGVADDMVQTTGIPAERITVINNPVLRSDLDSKAAEPIAHPWLQVGELPVFVAVGRLVPQKDFVTLIRAFALFRARHEVRLLILGNGPQESELQALIAELALQDSVQLAGFQSNPLPFVKHARALVASSRYEGFGNAIVEALACGTPVISTDCPYGPAEILDNGRHGRLVPVADVEAMAAAMDSLINETCDPASLRARAQSYHVDHIADRYMDLFASVSATVRALWPGRAFCQPRSVAIYLPCLQAGGAERSMILLADGLSRRGVRVSILVHSNMSRPAGLGPRVEIIDLGVRRSMAALPGLIRFLRKNRTDIFVSALTHNNIVATLAGLFARRKTRVVLTEHAPVSVHSRQTAGVRYRLLPILLPLVYPLADAVVSVSQGVRRDLLQLLRWRRCRLEVIYNPILPSEWQQLADAELDDPWFAPGAPPVILSAGRLNPEKEFAVLIAAFAQLHAQAPETRLLILGDGPEAPVLKALVVKLGLDAVVRLQGFVSNPFAYMRRAPVFVLTSRFEGFGNVLIEAMACGAQVISTDCPVGPREILDNGQLGQLIPVGDQFALVKALQLALKPSPVSAEAVRYATGFSVDSSVGRYLELFTELSSRKHNEAVVSVE